MRATVPFLLFITEYSEILEQMHILPSHPIHTHTPRHKEDIAAKGDRTRVVLKIRNKWQLKMYKHE